MLIRAFIERQWLLCNDTDSVSELKERLATAWDMQATDMEYVNKNWQLLHKDINVDDDAQLHQIFADAIKRHLSSPNSDGRPEVIFKIHLMMTVVLAKDTRTLDNDLEQDQMLEFGELPKRIRSDYIMTEQKKQCRRVLVHSRVAFNQVKKQSEDRTALLRKTTHKRKQLKKLL